MSYKSNFMLSRSLRLLCSFLTLVGNFAGGVDIARGEEKNFPPVKLRGYGEVSGFWEKSDLGGKPFSVLNISCESEGKARLVQAKYLSDIALLPGVQRVEIEVGGRKISTWQVKDQGFLTSGQDGRNVKIFASPDKGTLQAMVGKEGAKETFAAQVDVPMFLDRWDKYGLRFYFGPWSTPQNDKGYDLTQQIDWAAKQDHAGLVLWTKASTVDTAEGLTILPLADWALKAGKEAKLPVGLNTNAGFETPVWLLNRFRDQDAQKMPDYVGCFYDTGIYNLGRPGWLSWCATTGMDVLLANLQQDVKATTAFPNVTSYLEPHAETQHGVPDVLLEYGPTADASLQKYLQKSYSSVVALNKAWETSYRSWSEVKVPELASFSGWGPEAFDLKGLWKIKFEPDREGRELPVNALTDRPPRERIRDGAPEEWLAENFDDKDWPSLPAPGNDIQTTFPRWPAVFRRTFALPQGWRKKQERIWLYVWDLNRSNGKPLMKVVLNGHSLGETVINGNPPHRGVFEVHRDFLKEGNNVLAIRSPEARLNYKVYLSPDEPAVYPFLAGGLNQKWADFIDWSSSARVDAIRRGMEMIREVDPNRGIMMMSPDTYAGDLKDVAKEYGGDFHNTGYMAGWHCDRLPAWMRGVGGMPFSAEPGGPARTVDDFKRFFGNWITEAVNGVDYFMHIGDVMWDPAIRQYFEENLKIYKAIGKYHAPSAEVAALYSSRVEKLRGFPWDIGTVVSDPHPSMASGFVSAFNVRAPQLIGGNYESDAVSESSFLNGGAQAYRVIFDTNTNVLDEKTVRGIERYVREGGVFVTFGDTGRHSSGKANAWPIARLTGFQVNDWVSNKALEFAPEQTLCSGDWLEEVRSGGLALEQVAPDAEPLLLWQDGTVAVGMRPLGKGYIIQTGCSGPTEVISKLFSQILEWRKVATIPAKIVSGNRSQYEFRHFISNSGLYDVWVAWNESKEPLAGKIDWDAAQSPPWLVDIKDGSQIAVADHGMPIDLPPWEIKMFISPRADIAQAPEEWFSVQRAWWQGTKTPSSKLPEVPHKWSVDLSDGWAIKPLASGESAEPFVGTQVDDSQWQKVRMEVWNYEPGLKNVHEAILRKRFTVPANWTAGEAGFWLQSWDAGTFKDAGRVYVDGMPVTDRPLRDGVTGVNPDGVFKPGTTHTVAVEIRGSNTLNGAVGNAWLWFRPAPKESIDLSGPWETSADGLAYNGTTSLPGTFRAKVLRRTVTVPAGEKGRRAVIDLETKGPLNTVIINGQLKARHHHNIGTRWQLDITPWIYFGKPNEILILSNPDQENGVDKADLKFYTPDYL